MYTQDHNSLPVWFILSLAYHHISINSQPFLVGIVSPSEDKISSGSPLVSPEGSSPEQETPTVFIRSRDEENPSGSKPMPTFDPVTSLVGLSYFHLRRMGRDIEPRLPERLLKLLTRKMVKEKKTLTLS